MSGQEQAQASAAFVRQASTKAEHLSSIASDATTSRPVQYPLGYHQSTSAQLAPAAEYSLSQTSLEEQLAGVKQQLSAMAKDFDFVTDTAAGAPKLLEMRRLRKKVLSLESQRKQIYRAHDLLSAPLLSARSNGIGIGTTPFTQHQENHGTATNIHLHGPTYSRQSTRPISPGRGPRSPPHTSTRGDTEFGHRSVSLVSSARS